MPAGYESRYASNGDVRIHYIAAGSGPPIVFLHGFPDYWRGWRHQLDAFAARHRVVAPDLRGFNLSSAPDGYARYAMAELVDDVLAVLAEEKLSQASFVGHDWGGTIAYWLSIRAAPVVRHLVMLSAPHPRGYLKALSDPRQAGFAGYVREFQRPDSAASVDPARLSEWEQDPDERALLEAALRRSSAEAMMNYYRANIPAGRSPDLGALPAVKAPTLAIVGREDPYVPLSACKDFLDAGESATSLVVLPRQGHFIHHDAARFVTEQIGAWIGRPPSAYRRLT